MSKIEKAKIINLPLSKEDVLNLHTGDFVLINGVIVTGRDKIHEYLFKKTKEEIKLKYDLKGSIIYHCGPIVKKSKEGYSVISAGPTTSMRMEMYEHALISRYGIRGIMGKGGMGEKTHKSMIEYGCVYLNTIGGAATYLAERVDKVLDVWMLEEFGMVEAMWILKVKDFPSIVTMDTYGNNLHKKIKNTSSKTLKRLFKHIHQNI